MTTHRPSPLPATASVAENQRLAYTAVATDADGRTCRPTACPARMRPCSPSTRIRVWSALPRCPTSRPPGNADGDNVYAIVVTAFDGSNDTPYDVAITVTDVNEAGNAPVFTSDVSAAVMENQALAYTAVATDADDDDLTYSLSGTDAALFTIDPMTGAVSFIEAPDFENPDDAGGDNVYDIVVTASDGGNDTSQSVTITVMAVNDSLPIFTSPASASVEENQTLAYTAVATDADGDMPTYTLLGTDATLFSIDPTTGAVSFIAPSDFENPGDADGDNVYDIVVGASDGSNNTNHLVTITVTDVNDSPPVFTSPDAADVLENETLAYTPMVTDPDGGDPVYSLSGTDAALFTIDPNTGAVSFITPPDFENPADADGDNVYDIVVTASDGSNDTSQPVAITVVNVNDNLPIFTSAASVTLGEGRQAAYTAVATDADGNDLSYSLSGADAALFTIDLNTGVVSFIEAPDFDNPGDAGEDNIYNIIVTASDGPNSVSQDVAIAVANAGNNLAGLDGSNGFILNGVDAGDRSGYSVSSAGDVNGDGYDDLIIGANHADPNGDYSGATYVVYGGAGAPGTDGVLALSALDGSNGFILNGVDESDYSGVSVSSAGDVNGDGYDDLIIGAWRADPNGNDSGETYVVYGGATGMDLVLNPSTLDGANGFTLAGIDTGDRSGRSVSSAGDVNGDGYDDLIIGASYADPNGGDSGETYVVYGGPRAPGSGGLLNLSELDGTSGFILIGIDLADYSGYSVSSAGDVNGDGYDDLIIGANRADPSRSGSGETYVVYGGASAPGTAGVLALSALDGASGFTLSGVGTGDLSGSSVASAGDVNGDGYDDLIIGAHAADPNGVDSGETYVVYGGATGTDLVLERSALNGSNGFIIAGIDESDQSGYSVSSAGDVNGDGYDDLIIGARLADRTAADGTPLSDVGETYVIYGGAGAPGANGVLNLSALDGAGGFTLNGLDGSDYSGHSVSSAGDVNGDGYDDLIIGAYGASPNGENSGATYVVYGGRDGHGKHRADHSPGHRCRRQLQRQCRRRQLYRHRHRRCGARRGGRRQYQRQRPRLCRHRRRQRQGHPGAGRGGPVPRPQRRGQCRRGQCGSY